ncbi:AAA family ATPase [Halobacterium bonnevillei]|uniref:Replication factor C small subunit n=1 Tax=Halobacterium bonnevillei TaxID=2692200 RepID=A0A6B0STA3_9EURY|nr:AAA family ATPase [Halobacterium bonnevillei]MXR22040.1 AAA family ATPase [Halobacterium bonnevillei]
MDEPLWIDEHAPSLADIPQEEVRDRLRDATDEPVNLVVYGPEGAGKTAAVRALAENAHADPDNDLVELNVKDFFGMTKKEVSEDPRFAQFISSKRRRNSSKADLINHVLKESASYPPVSGDYNTIVLDNAEAIREDFQQALRRVMERHHEATQFVIVTRQPSKLIPPIRSRCFPVIVRAPTPDEIGGVLRDILEAEDVDFDEDGVEFVAGYAEGDLRKAILGAQTTAEQEGEVTMNAAYETLQEVGADDEIESMLADAEAGEFTDARSTLDDLLVDEGMSGEEVLEELLRVGRARYAGEDVAALHELAGDVEFDLVQGNSDRIQIGRLLAELGRDA